MAYRTTTKVSSGLYETCARHTNRFTSRILQSIYVCDPCAKRLTRLAFNGRNPVYHGQTVSGYCGLCNKFRRVTQRQWFVCGPCWNIVLSYQKSIAASLAIHKWWGKKIASQFPHLALDETEAVFLSPYTRAVKTKLQGAATISILDFRVFDTRRRPPKPLFHIEQKTGPESIDTMKSFQLDVNDYNDIAGTMNVTRSPSYVVHVFAKREYRFPTSRAVVQDMWWTDIYTLRKSLTKIIERRGQDKRAMYFKPGAFKHIGTFEEELRGQRHNQLAARLALRRIPLEK